MPSSIYMQALRDAAVNLQAVFNQRLDTYDPEADFPELEFVMPIGASALTVDLAFLGMDNIPKELTEKGREVASVVMTDWKKGYTKWTQTIELHEDDVKELDAKVPGWERVMNTWATGLAKKKAIEANRVLINCKTELCYDGQYLADTDHPSFHPLGSTQSNLLGYKFGRKALELALQAFENLTDPYTENTPLYNHATHILYAANIEFDVLEQVLSAVIDATSNPVLYKKLKPVKLRGLADDSFMILQVRDGEVLPIVEVYDDELGEDGVEWDEDDSQWFDHRYYRVGTLAKFKCHAGAWHKMLYSDGTAYHADDEPAE